MYGQIVCSDSRRKCTLSGQVIEAMEPHVEAFEGSLYVKKDVDVMDYLDRDAHIFGVNRGASKIMTGPLRISHCDNHCSESKSSCLLANFDENFDETYTICLECFSDILSSIKKYQKEIRDSLIYYHWSGFMVQSYNEPIRIHDSLSDKKKEVPNVLTFSADETYRTELSKICRIKNALEEPHSNKFCTVKHSFMAPSECILCGDTHSGEGSMCRIYEGKADGLEFCNKCSGRVISGIDKFVENNKPLLAALGI